MKRSELKVGDVLFFARKYEFDRGQGSRVKVLSCEPHRRNDYYPHNLLETGNGSGVLVETEAVGSCRARRIVVNLQQLRGPWDEVSKAQEEKRAEARAKSRARAELRDASGAICRDLSTALAAGEVDGLARADWSDPGVIAVTLSNAGAMRLTEILFGAQTPCG
jgi:hypothetical protein